MYMGKNIWQKIQLYFRCAHYCARLEFGDFWESTPKFFSERLWDGPTFGVRSPPKRVIARLQFQILPIPLSTSSITKLGVINFHVHCKYFIYLTNFLLTFFISKCQELKNSRQGHFQILQRNIFFYKYNYFLPCK